MPEYQPHTVYSREFPEGRPMTPAEREASDRHAEAYGRYMNHAESAWQPVLDALRAEGVEASLWQTGGGCLALGVMSGQVEVMIVAGDGPIEADGPSAYSGYVGDDDWYARVSIGLSASPDGLSGGTGCGIVLDDRWDDPTSWARVGRLVAAVLTHAQGATTTAALVEALDLSGIRGDDVEVYDHGA